MKVQAGSESFSGDFLEYPGEEPWQKVPGVSPHFLLRKIAQRAAFYLEPGSEHLPGWDPQKSFTTESLMEELLTNEKCIGSSPSPILALDSYHLETSTWFVWVG